MCFGGGGPSEEEEESGAEERIAAEAAKSEEIQRRAKQKREDISVALEGRTQRSGMRGGAGRRSLFRASGGGFLGRFS